MKKLINNTFLTIIDILQFGYLLMFYLKNQLYLKSPASSISKTVFQKLQTYDKVANIMLIMLACIVMFYCGYVLLKVKEKQIIIYDLVIMVILFIAGLIFYLVFLKNIYYNILINLLVFIGVVVIVLLITLFKIRNHML